MLRRAVEDSGMALNEGKCVWGPTQRLVHMELVLNDFHWGWV